MHPTMPPDHCCPVGRENADQHQSKSTENFICCLLMTWAQVVILKHSLIQAAPHMGHGQSTINPEPLSVQPLTAAPSPNKVIRRE